MKHVPTAFEAAANQDSLQTIRQIYGSRAQTLINILLSFDAYFAWYYPFMKSVPYLCPMEVRESRAFENCCTAIGMQEMFERVSIYSHGSFLPHGAVFKVTRDILEVGDVRAHDLSALELQNAESKRVFESGGARALECRSEGTTHKKVSEGEYRLVATKGYGSSAAISTLTKMLATSQLRAGDGMYSTPESRRSEKLFGEKATGRSKAIKLECLEAQPDYDPAKDTSLDAFVRMLGARASGGSV